LDRIDSTRDWGQKRLFKFATADEGEVEFRCGRPVETTANSSRSYTLRANETPHLEGLRPAEKLTLKDTKGAR